MNLPRLLLRLAFGRRAAVTSGDLRVPGCDAPLTIRRNKWGIPAVEAASDADAAFGIGFCHGQDRAAQLEVFLRVGRGTLAEWVGPGGLPSDRMSRRIGFHRAALRQLLVLSTPIRATVEAYARGVTTGHSAGLSAKPHEFAIVGGRPTPWEAADVLALLKLQTFLLPSNWDVELARLRLLRSDGPAAVAALDPLGTDETRRRGDGETRRQGDARFSSPCLPVSTSPCLDLLAADLAALQAVAPPGGGSNNWAIAGSRTVGGKPILANDPHLAPGVPAPWYVIHVRTPEWSAVGATLPGTPAVSIGHNGFAAWGVTAGLTDNTDLFVETLGPGGDSVRAADGSFTPCERVREVIRVKGGADVTEDVLLTPRGPVVSPLLPGVSEAVSLRAVWLDPLPFDGLQSAPRATSFETFRRPFADWPSLPLNVLYADAGGTIAWQLVGQLPVRKSGHGTLPLPADAPGTGWEPDLVPFESMPFVVNPSCGFLATANNAPTVDPSFSRDAESSERSAEDGDEPDFRGSALDAPTLRSEDSASRLNDGPFLGADFCDPYRAAVISDELSRRTDWDVAGCLKLQTSVRSLPWEEMRPLVLALEPGDSAAAEGLALLRAWDGRVDADSPAAAVFELFVAEMCVRVAKAKAPNGWPAALGESVFGSLSHSLFCDRRVGHLVRLLREQPPGWFPRAWAEETTDALAAVVRRLRKQYGPGPAYWGWGHIRQLQLGHPLFRRSRLLGPAFNLGPVPFGGDPNTVCQAGTRPAEPTAFTHNMPNLRMVFDLGDVAASRAVLCGGQSGNPASPHYDDQFARWQAGEAVPLPWDRDAIVREAVATLRLLPQTPG